MRNHTKRALVIGINYQGTPDELHGCEHDARAVANALRAHLSYRSEEIVTMVAQNAEDGDDDRTLVPTRDNIVTQMEELVKAANEDERLHEIFISYSGHGMSVRDVQGDGDEEVDGHDEAVVPQDYTTAGTIRDDQIAAWLRKFPSRCRVFLLCDSCHSGSMADLGGHAYDHVKIPGRRKRVRYVRSILHRGRIYRRFAYKWVQAPATLSRRAKKTTGVVPAARVVTLSGCRDPQSSVELPQEMGEGEVRWGGALTSAFLSAVRGAREKDGDLACLALCRHVHEDIQQRTTFDQVPVMCSNRPLANTDLFLRGGREDDACCIDL